MVCIFSSFVVGIAVYFISYNEVMEIDEELYLMITYLDLSKIVFSIGCLSSKKISIMLFRFVLPNKVIIEG